MAPSSTTKSTQSKTTKAQAEKAERTANEPENGPAVGNSGPGTGVPAPPESTYRPPATMTGDSPLDPPADSATQGQPEGGYNASSTDPVAAEAGRRTIAGEDFLRLVDAEGKELSAKALFDDSDSSKTFVVTKTRIYEEFYYPNTTEVAKRLLYAEGRRVPRFQADRIKAAVENAPAPAAEQDGEE